MYLDNLILIVGDNIMENILNSISNFIQVITDNFITILAILVPAIISITSSVNSSKMNDRSLFFDEKKKVYMNLIELMVKLRDAPELYHDSDFFDELTKIRTGIYMFSNKKIRKQFSEFGNLIYTLKMKVDRENLEEIKSYSTTYFGDEGDEYEDFISPQHSVDYYYYCQENIEKYKPKKAEISNKLAALIEEINKDIGIL